MAIKTILVHLADDADCPARLRTAATLAKRERAHLLALYITRPLELPVEITNLSDAELSSPSTVLRYSAPPVPT